MEGNLEIRTWNGQIGVYAVREFQPGERVIEVEGEETSSPSRYSVQVSRDRHLHPSGPDTPWMYVNHSCRPNLAFEPESGDFVARHAIQPGDQLTFNYLTTEWEMAEAFDCACGDDECVGRVAGFRHLSEADRERLLEDAAPHIRILEEDRPRQRGPVRVSSRAAKHYDL